MQSAIDTWVWYAGWSDKLSSLSGALNPVAGPYYNFTVPESMGVIAAIAPEAPSLLGLIGGLLAVPIAASIILIIDEVVFPRADNS